MRSLFGVAPAASITPAKVFFALLAVALGTAASIGRTTGPGALDTVLVEDGTIFLADAVNKGLLTAVMESYSGYFHLLPRLLGSLNALFPADWAAAAFAIEAAFITSVLALLAYTASAGYFQNKLQRVLVSAPMVLMPLAQDDLFNSVAMLRWQLMYAVFWSILWVSPSLAGRIIGPAVIAVAALSDNAVWIFVPLVLARLWARRDRESIISLVFLVAGTLASAYVVLAGITNRGTEPRIDPVWAAQAYVLRPLPHLLSGVDWVTLRPERTLAGLLPVVLAWAIAGLVVLLAWRTVTTPKWALAVWAAALSVALYFFCAMAVGTALSRYSAPVALLILTALVALLTPPRKWPLWVFTAMFAIVIVLNYRLPGMRTEGPRWSEELQKARVTCAEPGVTQAQLQVSPIDVYWGATLPCSYLNR